MTFLLASVTPVCIFLFIIYWRDTELEPIALLAKCFIGGFVAYGIALVIELIIGIYTKETNNHFTYSFYNSFINAAIPEEGAKFFILYRLIWKPKDSNFDQNYDGIVYAVFISMGLALIENITYIIKGGMSVAVLRTVLTVPAHGLFAVQMGYFLSKAKFDKLENQPLNLLKSCLVPILFHGLFDFALMYAEKERHSTALVALLSIMFCAIVLLLWSLGIKEINAMLIRDKTVVKNKPITFPKEND